MPDVPYGYCECGCGAKTRVSEVTSVRDGYVAGEPRRFLPSHVSRVYEPFGSPKYVARFWAKVAVGDTDACWEWQGCLDRNGYGRVHQRGPDGSKNVFAHRVMYRLEIGPLSDALAIDHLCNNPRCVNPAHLEAVMNGVNNLRGNSPWALNAKKTHCKNGHPLSGDNLRAGRKSARVCRTCARDAQRR